MKDRLLMLKSQQLIDARGQARKGDCKCMKSSRDDVEEKESTVLCIYKDAFVCYNMISRSIYRVSMEAEQPTQLKVKVVASLLSAEQLAGITSWDPHMNVKSEAISNGVLEQTLLCNQQDAVHGMAGRTSYHGSCYMTFKGMTCMILTMHDS